MKTTIDIPDDLLYRAKVVSAQRKTTLKVLVMHGLLRELDDGVPMPDAPDPLIEALSKGHNTKPVGRLNREQIHDRKFILGRRHSGCRADAEVRDSLHGRFERWTIVRWRPGQKSVHGIEL